MTLCRLSRSEAEYLMMAPSVVGGWVATHPDIRESVEMAIEGLIGHCRADFLALLPSNWDEARKRPVTPAQAAAIIVQLDHCGRYAVEPGGERVARDFAARVRAHIARGS